MLIFNIIFQEIKCSHNVSEKIYNLFENQNLGYLVGLILYFNLVSTKFDARLHISYYNKEYTNVW